jgi:hypothetical protein
MNNIIIVHYGDGRASYAQNCLTRKLSDITDGVIDDTSAGQMAACHRVYLVVVAATILTKT